MREKRLTKTVAFRLTADEHELLEWMSAWVGDKNVSVTVRRVFTREMNDWAQVKASQVKKLEAAAKRAAKKATTPDA